MLPIYVDSILVIHPENAYIESNKILSVKVEKEKASGIKFIDVLTTNPPKNIQNQIIQQKNKL